MALEKVPLILGEAMSVLDQVLWSLRKFLVPVVRLVVPLGVEMVA